MECPEYKAIVSCGDYLQGLMSRDCDNITPLLQRLISETTAEPTNTKSSVTGEILSDVQSSIKCNPKLYYKFLDFLREVDEGYYENVIRTVEEEKKKQRSISGESCMETDYSSSSPVGEDEVFMQTPTSTVIQVASYIRKVKKKMSMAILMGLGAGYWDIIASGPPEEKHIRLAQWWVKSTEKSLQLLVKILLEPALQEKRIAKEIKEKLIELEPSHTSHDEVDAVFPHKDELEEPEKQEIPCTLPTVLNFLAGYASHWEAIGQELIGQDKVRKIKSDRWAEGDETAYVVEEWQRCTDEVEFSWKRLKEAINNAIEVTEQSNKSQQTSDVIASLENEFEDMCKQYRNSLTKDPKKYDQFCEAIQDLPFRWRGLNRYYDDAIDNLVNKEDIKGFFKNVKGRLWNFVDYEFFKYLIEQSNDTELLERMTPYEKKVKEMCKTTTIHDFIVEWDPKFDNDDYYSSDLEVLSEFMIKFEKWDSKKYKIAELQSVLKCVLIRCKERISQKYGMAAFVLQKISEGSVTVWIIFTVPTHPFKNKAKLLDLDQKEIMELAQEVVGLYDDISLFVFEGYIVCPMTAQTKVWNVCREGNLAKLNSLLDKVNIDHKYEEVYSQTTLQCAAKYGHVSIVDFLMDRGADIDHRDASGHTALLIALKNCQKDVVHSLIRHRANPDIKEEVHGMCPLLEAAEHNDADIVEALLDNKATITVKNNKNRNAFMMAARKGHVKVVRLLLDYKDCDIDINEVLTDQDGNGCTVLHAAAESGNEEVIQLFLPNAAEIIDIVNKEGRSALAVAAQCGHKNLVEVLLNNGADAFHIDAIGENVLGLSSSHQDLNQWLKTTLEDKMISSARDGDLKTVLKALKCGIHPDARERDQCAWTALHWASENGHLDVVDHLLNSGAEPNAEDKFNWTSLLLASRNGHLGVVKRLLNGGADPNKTKTTWTPLTWAAECNHLEITKVLLESGANPNIYDELGLSPLYQAAQNGHKDVVKALVEESKFEIEIDHITELAWPALFVAVTNGYEEIVEYLVEKGADVSYQKRDDTAALHLACFKENFFITKLLVKKKANVNVQDSDGLTPLMFAASHGQLKLVRLLVEDGRADLNMAENMNQWTAVFLAMQAKHHDVMKYLLDTKRIKLNHTDEKGNTLFDLTETVNPEAFQYLKENFKEDKKLAEQERTAAGLPKLTAKILMGETGSPYYAPMIQNIHSKSIKAAA